MNDFPILTASLLDLLYELRDTSVRLIVCGGFGLYLKQQSRREDEVPTLLVPIAEARSTQDLDIFLKTEILAYPELLTPLREALEHLGYSAVRGAEYYHFARPVQLPGGQGRVKIDLLTGPPHPKVPHDQIRSDDWRVKPAIKNSRIHGRLTTEAFTLEDHAWELTLTGHRTTGEFYEGTLYLPQTFHYLVMKLIAYRDAEAKSSDLFQPDDERANAHRNAVKHSFDLYTTLSTHAKENRCFEAPSESLQPCGCVSENVSFLLRGCLAGTNEDDWEEANRLSGDYQEEPVVNDAARIVSDHFSNPDGLGLLRLRENAYATPEMELDLFRVFLREVFGLDQDTEACM